MDVVLALLLGENLLEWGGGLEGGGKKFDRRQGGADSLGASKSIAGVVF